MQKPLLFTPLRLRGVTAPNRSVVSPMVQYRAIDGQVNDYHLVHLGKFALGKFGIVFTENCAIEPRGRVTQGDLGMWDDGQIEGHKRLVRFLKQEGALAGTQITHAGRKGSTPRSFDKPGQLGPAGAGWQKWEVVGPSELSAAEGWQIPRQLGTDEIDEAGAEVRRGRQARRCGGLRRHRDPRRARLSAGAVPVADQQHPQRPIRRRPRRPHALPARRRRARCAPAWPVSKPMFIRVSTVDGAGGWEVEDTVVFAKALKELGVDVIDCSSGGLTGLSTALPVKRSLGFQVPFAAAVKRQAGIHTMAVGLILDGPQAEAILQAGDADLIAIGRQALFDPFWALHAAQELGCDADFAMWTPEYGWWLDKRRNNLVDLKK